MWCQPKISPAHANYCHPAGARIRGAETSVELSFLLERSPGETKISTTIQVARPSENPKPCGVFRNAFSSQNSLHIVEASKFILYCALLSPLSLLFGAPGNKDRKTEGEIRRRVIYFPPHCNKHLNPFSVH